MLVENSRIHTSLWKIGNLRRCGDPAPVGIRVQPRHGKAADGPLRAGEGVCERGL